jgi:hypothetical protein
MTAKKPYDQPKIMLNANPIEQPNQIRKVFIVAA